MGSSSSTLSATSTSAVVQSSTLVPATTTTSSISTTSVITSSTPVATGCSSVPAPAPTQTGIVSGCTAWHTAVSGEYCALIAQNYNISTNQFISWNPAVGTSCQSLYAGDAYCVGISCPAAGSSVITSSTSTPATTSFATSTRASATRTCPTATSTSTVNAGSDTYTAYYGDGSPSAGWPCMSQWVDFNSMWTINQPLMNQSCTQFGQPNDSADEMKNIHDLVVFLSASFNIDQRFVLAIIMQESKGCVRAPTTNGTHLNPGLMQSNQGTGSCNLAMNGGPGLVQCPCPFGEIDQMIIDGTNGTGPGQYGLVQYRQIQGLAAAQGYYRTARSYNSGSIGANGDLGSGLGTLSYASDVANRLTGWVFAPSTYQS